MRWNVTTVIVGKLVLKCHMENDSTWRESEKLCCVKGWNARGSAEFLMRLSDEPLRAIMSTSDMCHFDVKIDSTKHGNREQFSHRTLIPLRVFQTFNSITSFSKLLKIFPRSVVIRHSSHSWKLAQTFSDKAKKVSFRPFYCCEVRFRVIAFGYTRRNNFLQLLSVPIEFSFSYR